MTTTTQPPSTTRTSKYWRAGFYRSCRDWHGYLSAFAFLALIFFSATGLTLNHPEWTSRLGADEETRRISLSSDQLSSAAAENDQAAALAAALKQATRLRGAYASGDILDGEALLRFEGPSGASDATINLTSGAAEISVRRAGLLAMLNDLHRGRNAGAAWRLFIDIAAILVLALSLIGYLLFFSLRFRLRTSTALTGGSLVALVALVLAFVP
jgi:hypothetical protein